MAINPKDADADFAAKRAADDARVMAQKQQDQARWQQQQEADARHALENSPQAQAANAAARQQQEAESKAIVGGVLGAVGIVTGIALMNKLDGVTPMATLSGPQGSGQSGVIQNIAQQSGFTVASPANPAASGPQNIMNTAMAFLTPQNKGP